MMVHPHIIELFDKFYERGSFFMVMEYADGFDLRKKVGSFRDSSSSTRDY